MRCLAARVLIVLGTVLGRGWAQDASVSAGTIAPIAAFASGSQASNPAMAIDGSGLSEDPDHPGAFRHIANRWADSGSMWCSGGEAVGSDGACWFKIDLGRSAQVTALHLWNYNESGGWQHRSIKTFDLLTSPDDHAWSAGGTYHPRCAAGNDQELGEEVVLAAPVTARYLKLVITAHYGRDNLVGLSELRVRVTDPQPGDRVLAVRPPFTPRYPRTTYDAHSLGVMHPGSDHILWPADAGVVDASKAPYGAKGDGTTDDTTAIQRAFDDHVADGTIIYLPNGLYRISDTIRWGSRKGADSKPKVGDAEKFTTLMGESERGTVIRLDDHAAGFGNARAPKPVIWTGGDPAQRFGNEIAHLTVDTGAGNPGCSGVAFVANNQGAITSTTIVSGDGQGLQGLNLAAAGENGPLLVRGLTVIGFDIGIAAAGPINSMTMEGVTLRDQNLLGIRSFGQHLSIRTLTSRNAVPALEIKGAVTVLLDATLEGVESASRLPAIIGTGALLGRRISAPGYARAREGQDGTRFDETVSRPTVSLDGGAATGLNLPIKELPPVRFDPPSQWASPLAFGAKPDDGTDAGPAIQRAIDSGATTVYLPRGMWRIKEPIVLRGAVRRLVGCRAFLDTLDGHQRATPLIRIADGDGPIDLERITGPWHGTKVLVSNTKRTVILRHCSNVSADFSGGGEVFLDDVVNNPGANFTFTGVTAWARQFNAEPQGVHILNDRSQLWILGLKTESWGTLIETRNGGATELLGGLCYNTGGGAKAPMFLVTDSRASFSIGEVCWSDQVYRVIVQDHQGTQLRELLATDPRWSQAMALCTCGHVVP